MQGESKFTEETWANWLEPFQAVRMLIDAGLGDREHAVNWLKGRLRNGALDAGGPHLKMLDDSFTKTTWVWGRYKTSTWSNVSVISWKDDFWVSGDYAPDDPLEGLWRKSDPDEFRHYLSDVRFDPEPILAFCAKAGHPVGISTSVSTSQVTRGGRPPKPIWDDLWSYVAAALYNGDLNPQRQADIERAMQDWLTANGHDLGESTVRRAARKLWQAIDQEVQN